MGNIKNTQRFNDINEDQAEDRFQVTYHNVHETHYGPDKKEKIIVNSEMNDIEMNTDESLNKNNYRADVDDNTEN